MFDMSQEFGEKLLIITCPPLLFQGGEDGHLYKVSERLYISACTMTCGKTSTTIIYYIYTRDFHWECSRIVRQYHLEVTQDLAIICTDIYKYIPCAE